jgi:hypothetical protein
VYEQVGPAVRVQDARHVVISDLTSRTLCGGAPLIELRAVDGASVRGCIAPAHARVLDAEDGSCRQIVGGNDAHGPAQAEAAARV